MLDELDPPEDTNLLRITYPNLNQEYATEEQMKALNVYIDTAAAFPPREPMCFQQDFPVIEAYIRHGWNLVLRVPTPQGAFYDVFASAALYTHLIGMSRCKKLTRTT